jgi:hypothetical protein
MVTERPFYGVPKLSGFTNSKTFVVIECLEAHVVTSEEIRMVTETTTGVNKEKINTLRETFLIRK